MELSCKNEYALLALMELAAHYTNGEPLQIRQISAHQNIPDRYLEQVLATLRRAGLVRSQRGARGGYILAREPWQISLLEIMNSLEGTDAECGDREAPSKTVETAVIVDVWKEANQAAKDVLQRYSLKDLCEKRDARRQLDIMYYI